MISLADPAELRRKLGTVGRAVRGVRTRVLADAGREVGAGAAAGCASAAPGRWAADGSRPATWRTTTPTGTTSRAAGPIDWLRLRVARHQMPREVEFRAELPYTPVGKPDKKALRG